MPKPMNRRTAFATMAAGYAAMQVPLPIGEAKAAVPASAAPSAPPGLPAAAHPVVSRPADVTAMTTADLLAERQTASTEVWRVIQRHNDVWNELERRGIDPAAGEADYQKWKQGRHA